MAFVTQNPLCPLSIRIIQVAITELLPGQRNREMTRNLIVTLIAFFLLCPTRSSFPVLHFQAEVPGAGEFQQLVIPKGQHEAQPYWMDIARRTNLHLQHIFTESAKYDLGTLDQYDWNKLTGVAVGWPEILWTNHENSAMVSWRWGLECNCVELGIYMHGGGKRYILRNRDGSEVFATVAPGEVLESWIHLMQDESMPGRNWMGVTIKTPDHYAYAEKEFFVNVRDLSRVINPWFGGQAVAPHDIYILRRQLPKE